MDRQEAYSKLEALYASLPKLECKKKCQACCGSLQMARIESQHIEEKTGGMFTEDLDVAVNPSRFLFVARPYYNVLPVLREMTCTRAEPNGDCQFLMPVIGTCRVYARRPLICRLWGMVNHPLMRCPHGCVPERWLTYEESQTLLRKVLEIQREVEICVAAAT